MSGTNPIRFPLILFLLLSHEGANAEASLYNTGSYPLFVYARQIDQIPWQAARGEWPAAREGLFELQRALPVPPQG